MWPETVLCFGMRVVITKKTVKLFPRLKRNNTCVYLFVEELLRRGQGGERVGGGELRGRCQCEAGAAPHGGVRTRHLMPPVRREGTPHLPAGK